MKTNTTNNPESNFLNSAKSSKDLEIQIKEYISESYLKEVSGTDDLRNVTTIKLIVDTTENSMGDIGKKLPNLKQLKLNNSSISSVRDLGTSLRDLQVLWMSHVGIKELDGIGTLENVKELYLAFNNIQELSPLMSLEHLQVLDLEENRVDSLDEVQFLQGCSELHSLNLQGNPLESDESYRVKIAAVLPGLKYLDDVRISRREKIKASRLNIE